MFPYSDPSGTLKPARALVNHRFLMHLEYVSSARLAGSAFTLLEAFEGLPANKRPVSTAEWAAFPRSANVSNAQIDANRFSLQDEYVEWRVEKVGATVRRITFTTEFLAYYESLARVGRAELVAAIKAVVPGAAPTVAQLYGPGFNPASQSEEARGARFRQFAQQNPWINGQRDILCLAHGSSTLGALFRLVDAAAVPKPATPIASICAALGGNCVSSPPPGGPEPPSIYPTHQQLPARHRLQRAGSK